MDWELIASQTLLAFIGDTAIVFALAAVGLNVHYGYTGLLNFGQVAFMLMGAYGVSVVVATYSGPLWLGILASILGGVALALALGVPTLRLRADYLAIVTIAVGETLRFIARSPSMRDVTNGSFGVTAFAQPFYALNPLPPGRRWGIDGFLTVSSRNLYVLIVGWSLVALAALLVYLLMRSPWGRVLKSIREDEDAAASLGKNVFAYKMQSLVLGGVLGSVAGLVLALSVATAQPDYYVPPVTFFVFTGLVLGGAGTVIGPIVGAALFWALLSFTDVFLREAIGAGVIPSSVLSGVQVGQVRFMLVGLGLMLLMIFRPQGIFGDKRELVFDV